MTDDELNAIEARATKEVAENLYADPKVALRLVAEVRRLQKLLEEFGSCDRCGARFDDDDGHGPGCTSGPGLAAAVPAGPCTHDFVQFVHQVAADGRTTSNLRCSLCKTALDPLGRVVAVT